jgi:menaquinol-cytochrome c reductase iron-sulfur subunit
MQPSDQPPQPDRRNFLKQAWALLLGGLTTIVPTFAGLQVLFDPLRRKLKDGDFVRVASLNALPEDGTPQRFPVIADREDAWNKFPQVPVGAVYLRRVGANKVEALNASCPHAGCGVEYKTDRRSFLCPCHDSSFHLDGSLANLRSPSPRALDSLEVQIRDRSEVWVRFQNFEAGKASKVPRT